MATPYLQMRRGEVPSTQDVARDSLSEIPVVVMATSQSAGRGRSGVEWVNAPRALATSLAWRLRPGDNRPFSLMAGIAACEAAGEACRLKWPNDVVVGVDKVGGILVEVSAGVAVVGMGLNLWWPDPPEGAGAVYDVDPGPERHSEVAGLWAAEMMRLLDAASWPADRYRELCVTLGREIRWEPDGAGTALDVGEDGGLLVDTGRGPATLRSGAVRHVRG